MSDITILLEAVNAAGIPNSGVWKSENAEYFVHFKLEATDVHRAIAQQIIDGLPLAVAKDDKSQELVTSKTSALVSEVSEIGSEWKVDTEFLLTLIGALLSVPMPTEVTLYDANEVLRTVPITDLQKIIATTLNRTSTIRELASSKQAQIDAATTAQDVQAVDTTMP